METTKIKRAIVADEQEILRKNYSGKTYSELSELLPGKSRGAINKMAFKMGLKKNPKKVVKNGRKTKADKSNHRANNKNDAPKKELTVFKTKVVDPAEIIKVRVNSKTVLEIKKGHDVSAAVARFHANEAKNRLGYKG